MSRALCGLLRASFTDHIVSIVMKQLLEALTNKQEQSKRCTKG